MGYTETQNNYYWRNTMSVQVNTSTPAASTTAATAASVAANAARIRNEAYAKANGFEGLPALVADDQGRPYVVVRTYSAGVFAGFMQKRDELEVTMVDARRIWYWDGASSLSELAMKGVAHPENCKFPCALPFIILTQAIEIIPATARAKKSIDGVKEWKQMD